MPRRPKRSVRYLMSLIKDVQQVVSTNDGRVRALPEIGQIIIGQDGCFQSLTSEPQNLIDST